MAALSYLSPTQAIYSWFSAVIQQDIEAMAQTIEQHNLAIDSLHPLRQTTALMEATRLGRDISAIWLVEHGAAPGLLSGHTPSTPLHSAVRRAQASLVTHMLQATDNVQAADQHGRTALHMLAQYAPHTQATLWLDIAKSLIHKQLRIDALDSEGITALHYALIHEWPALTELLLEMGANPNALALDTGVSPLLMAALNQQRDMVRLLLRYGANPDLPSISGKTATALMPDIARMLSEKLSAPKAAPISPTALL